MTEHKSIGELQRGCVVKMKASSGLVGYGNEQCVSAYIEPLGEVYLFGHNEGFKSYDIEKIISYPHLNSRNLLEVENETKNKLLASINSFLAERGIKDTDGTPLTFSPERF